MATEDMLATNATSKILGVENLSNVSRIDSGHPNDPSTVYNLTASRMYLSAVSQNLTRLDVSDCIHAYATSFQTSRGSLILVTENSTNLGFAYSYGSSNALQRSGFNCPPNDYGWICGQVVGTYCNPNELCSANIGSIDQTDWKPFGNKIEYCLSEQLQQQCTVEFSPQLAGVVIAFNALKTVVLVYIFLAVKENPLLTMGDAVFSFLSIRDDTTRALCLMDKASVAQWIKGSSRSRKPRQPTTFKSTVKCWRTAVSSRRWYFIITL
jgi:hypothetical protein